jgi:hypothetical protein
MDILIAILMVEIVIKFIVICLIVYFGSVFALRALVAISKTMSNG